MKILFVCLGNICRSPMAEAYMHDLIIKNNATAFSTDSCGTSGWHKGERLHRGTLDVLVKDGIDVSMLQSRPLVQSDFETFDVIIGMDKANVLDLQRLAPEDAKHKIHLFLDVMDETCGQDVPDPWYTGDFNETRRLISTGVQAWYQTLNETV